MASACAPEVQSGKVRAVLRLNPAMALFLGALVPGLYTWFRPQGFGFGHGFEMVAIAKSLVAQGTFGNPFEPAITGPTAEQPPLYPLFLAALIKIFHEPMCGAAALLANIVVNALIAALLPRLAKIFYGDALPGIFAGILWIFAMRLMPQWDTSFTIAGLLLFGWISTRKRGVLAAGLIAGLLSLMNPACLLLAAAWTAYLVVSRRIPRSGAAMVLIALLCNVPWLIRNYSIWHTLVVRTNFGTTFYSSNNDCAQASLARDGRNGCFQKTNLVESATELGLLQSLGEVQYERRRVHDGLAWVRTHPQRFRQLTLARIAQFWFPEPDQSPFTVYAIWVITLLSIPGVVLMARRRETATWFVLLVWLVYPLMYYIVISCDRYRYPILWTSLLPAGYWLTRFCRGGK